jgi:hypothetical protein
MPRRAQTGTQVRRGRSRIVSRYQALHLNIQTVWQVDDAAAPPATARELVDRIPQLTVRHTIMHPLGNREGRSRQDGLRIVEAGVVDGLTPVDAGTGRHVCITADSLE